MLRAGGALRLASVPRLHDVVHAKRGLRGRRGRRRVQGADEALADRRFGLAVVVIDIVPVEIFRGGGSPWPRRGYSVEAATAEVGFLDRRDGSSEDFGAAAGTCRRPGPWRSCRRSTCSYRGTCGRERSRPRRRAPRREASLETGHRHVVEIPRRRVAATPQPRSRRPVEKNVPAPPRRRASTAAPTANAPPRPSANSSSSFFGGAFSLGGGDAARSGDVSRSLEGSGDLDRAGDLEPFVGDSGERLGDSGERLTDGSLAEASSSVDGAPRRCGVARRGAAPRPAREATVDGDAARSLAGRGAVVEGGSRPRRGTPRGLFRGRESGGPRRPSARGAQDRFRSFLRRCVVLTSNVAEISTRCSGTRPLHARARGAAAAGGRPRRPRLAARPRPGNSDRPTSRRRRGSTKTTHERTRVSRRRQKETPARRPNRAFLSHDPRIPQSRRSPGAFCRRT